MLTVSLFLVRRSKTKTKNRFQICLSAIFGTGPCKCNYHHKRYCSKFEHILGENFAKTRTMSSETRNKDHVKKLVHDAKAIMLDIEGTITPFDFVKGTLYPFAESNLYNYIMENWRKPEVQQSFVEIEKQALIDQSNNIEGFVPIIKNPVEYENHQQVRIYLHSIFDNLKWQMANDRKTTGLKAIQGLMWKIGYERGLIKGELYEDIFDPLKEWEIQGKDVYIYSSGSKQAQIYLLKYSEFGDVTKFFRDFFDTTIGSKMEPSSYRNICEEIKRIPEEVIFFTDRPLEIFAAKECGLKTILVVRDPDHPLLKEEARYVGIEHGQIQSFSEIL